VFFGWFLTLQSVLEGHLLPESAWKPLKNRLRSSLNPEEFQVWVEPLEPLPAPQGGLVLGCPNAFHRNWVRTHYLPRMRALLGELGHTGGLRLEVVPGGEERRPHQQLSLPRVNDFAPRFNRRFVFERFVTGSCNEFACAAAKALAQGRQMFNNTLFLVSSTGLGKSHLTQSVGQQVLGEGRPNRVAYLTAEDFANQMIAALKRKRIEEFKERFRHGCDVLLLEEVQFLAGKDKTQDELGYTLDILLDMGKRVVFTGAAPPSRIKGLKTGLASRLASGVTVHIDPPDHATRRGILEHLAQEERLSVPGEVLEFLAEEITGDVRRLQSALMGLMTRASLTGRPPDLSHAGELVGQLDSRPRRLGPQDICRVVAQVYGLEQALLGGKSRAQAVTKPRNLAMFLCRRHTDASYASIGRAFNRDHSTVMYGVSRVERGLKHDGKLNQEVAFLEQRLGVNEG
jgi:chromosomal replication initiator protein